MKQSAELAYQYGPFFFSLLFLVSISRWSYRNYNAACKRTNPPASEKEISALKNTYLTSFFVGTVLVLASVIWWFLFRPQRYYFGGEIKSLEQYDNLQSDSESIFFRSHYETAPYYQQFSQTAYFLIVGDKPFSPGDGFDLDLYKGTFNKEKITQDRNILHVEYDPKDPSPIYELDCCDKKGQYTLKKTSTQRSSFLNETVVYAAPSPQEADAGNARSSSSKPKTSSARVTVELTSPLKDPSADIGERSLILQRLQSLDREALAKALDDDDSATNASDDPLVLTILDLTRHSDKQLAYRARSVLAQLDVNLYIAARLVSSNEGTRRSAERILFRVDTTMAGQILQLAKSKGWKSATIEQEIESGEKTRVLVPTWIPAEKSHNAGDWYFLKVMWNPADHHTLDCLTKLFHKELISQRTIEQERELMKQKNGVRYIYWDEAWVLKLSDSVADCGAKFAFVHPGQ